MLDHMHHLEQRCQEGRNFEMSKKKKDSRELVGKKNGFELNYEKTLPYVPFHATCKKGTAILVFELFPNPISFSRIAGSGAYLKGLRKNVLKESNGRR